MYSVHNVASFLRTCNSISTRWLLRPPPPAALAAGSSSSLSSFFTIQTCGVATSLYRSSSITQEVSTIASVKRFLSYSSGLTSVTCSAGIPCVRLPPPSELLLLLLFYVAAKPSSRRFFWPFAGFSLHPIRSRSGAVLQALPGFGSGWQPAARVQVVASAAAASGLLHGGSRMTSSHGKRMVTRACCVLLAGSKCCKDLLCRASRIRYICDH